jgi:O-antigen/teichoic acid export membrane protein
MSIGISLLPKAMKEREPKMRIIGYSFVSVIVLISTIPMLIITSVYSETLIAVTFGHKYSESSEILFIISLSCVFSVIGFITNRIINSYPEGGRYLMKKAVFSSVFAIILSYYLVGAYQLEGAAIGLLLSEILNVTIFNYLFKNRIIIEIHKSMLISFSYFRKYREG